MQSHPQNQQAAVVLKDGHSQLATWTQAFDLRPTIGERVEIPDRFKADLDGYEMQAVVTRVELRDPLPDRIDLEAKCLTQFQDRPVIVLNSDRIRISMHQAAEVRLRATLRHPIITWESSTHPDPVVRFHDPASGGNSCPADVRAGLLDLLQQPASV